MPADAFIEFERPGWLVLILLVLPTYLIARASLGGLSPLKQHVTFALRALVILFIALALSKPVWLRRGEGLTVVMLVDRSRSIPYARQVQAADYLRAAAEVGRQKEDRLGVVAFAGDSLITALPNRLSNVDVDAALQNLEATNIAEAVRLALAALPRDTAVRLVLVSDGNETEDSVVAAAKIAQANHVTIDVLPVRYEHAREVLFERLDAPARAREGAVSEVRMILRAQAETSGTLTLLRNGTPVDLDPDAPGESVRVTLRPGVNRREVPILFDRPGPQRFRAVFEPDDSGSDAVVENNSAVGVTFVSGDGRILVVDETGAESEALVGALREGELKVDVVPADAVDSLVMLAGYDAVILVNQPRYNFTPDQDAWLHAYVHDLGGGLIVTGGDKALGAGGWIDQQLADALPVNLDPPQTMQRQRGALGLIMHSCEIPQGNFWGERVAIAAIEALSRLDYVGILDFDWNAGGVAWEYDKTTQGLALAGDKQAAIAAAKNMPVGDMPDFGSAMTLMLQGMLNVPAQANRHVIIISDGDPAPPTAQLLDRYLQNSITVTTVMIGGHVTPQTMQYIANKTGGRFYNVTNPNTLPQIFIEESRLVARSLIVEEGRPYEFDKTSPLSEPTRGYESLPPVRGYVLTAPKEGLAEVAFVSDAHNDPLYAHWNYGLGKSVVFTPDVAGRWAADWVAWEGFKGFWDQTVRWAMRPASPPNMIVKTEQDGAFATVEVEALDADASFLNFLNVGAVVLPPEGESAPLSMEQVGPGRYRARLRTDHAGAYLVNMSFSEGEESLGNLQAAITVPYAREFRDISDNARRLEQVADVTGGRVLPSDPTLANLWDRTGLEVRRSKLSVWDLFAILAAAVFLLDVAARRLAIGTEDVRRFFGNAFGRRGEGKGDSMEAFRKAKYHAARRRGETVSSAEDDLPVETADRAARFEASEEDREQAISVGDETKSDVGAPRPKKGEDRDAAAEEKPDQGDGDYTSRLLAAKRRARKQEDESGGTSNSGGGES